MMLDGVQYVEVRKVTTLKDRMDMEVMKLVIKRRIGLQREHQTTEIWQYGKALDVNQETKLTKDEMVATVDGSTRTGRRNSRSSTS